MLEQLTYNFYTEKLPYWLGFIVFTAIIGIIFMVRAHRISEEAKIQKWIYWGYALFFFMYIGSRILYLFSDVANMNFGQTSTLYTRLVFIAYLFTVVALSFQVITIERFMTKSTKRIFTIISIINICVLTALFFLTFLIYGIIDIGRIYMYVAFGISLVFLGSLYIYLVGNTSGVLKRNSAISLVGLIVFIIGNIMDSSFLVNMQLFPIQLTPIVAAIGVLLFAIGQRPI